MFAAAAVTHTNSLLHDLLIAVVGGFVVGVIPAVITILYGRANRETIKKVHRNTEPSNGVPFAKAMERDLAELKRDVKEVRRDQADLANSFGQYQADHDKVHKGRWQIP